MPAEGLDWLPSTELLTDDELLRLIRIGTEDLGIDEVRFTGGEPLLRRGIVELIGRVAALPRRPRAVDDHQRPRAGPQGHRAGRGRAGPDQRLTGHDGSG